MNDDNASLAPPTRDRVSGVVIALSAVLFVVGMSHHPSAHGEDTRAFLEETLRIATLNRLVHGGLMAMTVCMAFGFVGFAAGLGLGRPLVRFGLVTYLCGSVALIGAALVNGLVLPSLAERFLEASDETLASVRVVLAWNWEINQALTFTGVLAWSAAVLAWSLALMRHAGAWRWIGAAGSVLGVVGAGTFLTGVLTFDVHGFGLYVLAQSAWCLALGVRLACAPRPSP